MPLWTQQKTLDFQCEGRLNAKQEFKKFCRICQLENVTEEPVHYNM